MCPVTIPGPFSEALIGYIGFHDETFNTSWNFPYYDVRGIWSELRHVYSVVG
jgi:hypothetical protein